MPKKTDSSVRAMVDAFSPPLGLLCKLGSIVVHVDEGSSDAGHAYDWTAARSLIADREVQEWLTAMDAKGFLPKRR